MEQTISKENFFTKSIQRIKSKALQIWENKDHLFWYILFLFVVAIVFFFNILIHNSLSLPLSGDYSLQQIPFYTNGYDDWWKFLKTGEFPMWDYSTYLGVNNIGSNTFYYLLNPFFLPILLWPREYIAQGLATLMIIKMVLAGVTFRAFLKYVGIKEHIARLFALAYAFCGWNVYYLWFNHFLEVCVVFPLILLGIEKIIREKRPWVLMASLALMGLCNYFFLVSSCFCGVVYAVYRYFCRFKEMSKRDKLLIIPIGVGAFLVGIMIASITLFPAYAVFTSSSRVEGANFLKTLKNALNAKDFKKFFQSLLEFDSEKKKYYPLVSFLFPSISDYSSILFNNKGYDNTLCSIFIYTPLMMFFIPSVLQTIRKKRVHHLVAIGFFLLTLFTPFFYYLCYGFTLDYGRWQIFAVASILVFIAQNYEEREEMPSWFFDVSLGTVLIGVIIAVSFALGYQDKHPNEVYELGDRIYVVIGQVLYIFVCYFYLRFRHNKKDLTKILTGVIAIEAVVMGTITFSYQPPNNYSTLYGGPSIVREEEKIIRALQEQDDGFYRIFNTNSDRNSNNLPMREGYKGVSTFHSLFNSNLQEFNNWSRVGYSYGNWSMGVHEKRYNLDEFLNIKYYIQKTLTTTQDGQAKLISNNIPGGFVEMPELETKEHKVYKNTNFIELGYAYDSIMSSSSLNYNYVNRNEIAYLTSAILGAEDMEKVKEMLPGIEEKQYSSISNLNMLPTEAYVMSSERNKQFQEYVNQLKASNEAYKDYTNIQMIEPVKNAYGFDYLAVESIRGGSISCEWKDGAATSMIVKPREGYSLGKDATAERPYYVNLHLRMGENAMVNFYNADGKLVTWDNHMWHYYDNTYDFKYDRGFYIREEVETIEVIIYANAKMDYPTITYEPYEKFYQRIQALKGENDENLFKNIKVTDNHINFDTNYSKKKMIVLSVPYEAGWSGKYTLPNGEQEPIQIFKAQGGFLGFVAPEGEVHYALSYFTPNLKEALLLCVSGIVLFASSWGAVYIYEKKRKKETQIEEIENQ